MQLNITHMHVVPLEQNSHLKNCHIMTRQQDKRLHHHRVFHQGQGISLHHHRVFHQGQGISLRRNLSIRTVAKYANICDSTNATSHTTTTINIAINIVIIIANNIVINIAINIKINIEINIARHKPISPLYHQIEVLIVSSMLAIGLQLHRRINNNLLTTIIHIISG